MTEGDDQVPIAEAFDALAEHWDSVHGPESPRARQFRDRISYLRFFCMRNRPSRVLEIGCGTGQNLIGIADLLIAGIGADVSSAMAAHARRNAESLPSNRLHFIVGDALALSPQALGLFDAVLFVGALEHIEPQPSALRLGRHLLNPGGRMVVIMPHPWQPLMLLKRKPHADGHPIPTRMLSPWRLQMVAHKAGLTMSRLFALTYGGFPSRRRTEPWHPLPLNRLGSLSAARGSAYAAELEGLSPRMPA